MTPETQRYYEDRLDMMGGRAWKDLMEDVQRMYDASNRLDAASLENFEYRRGELSIMRWMLSLKEVSEQSYEGLKIESDV